MRKVEMVVTKNFIFLMFEERELEKIIIIDFEYLILFKFVITTRFFAFVAFDNMQDFISISMF